MLNVTTYQSEEGGAQRERLERLPGESAASAPTRLPHLGLRLHAVRQQPRLVEDDVLVLLHHHPEALHSGVVT